MPNVRVDYGYYGLYVCVSIYVRGNERLETPGNIVQSS